MKMKTQRVKMQPGYVFTILTLPDKNRDSRVSINGWFSFLSRDNLRLVIPNNKTIVYFEVYIGF